MTVAALAFAALALAALILGARAYARIEAQKNAERERLATVTVERKARPLIFVSYRATDREEAMACAKMLEGLGCDAVAYDPEALWDDPIEEIVRGISTANAIVYVTGTSSDWIRAERELADENHVPFFAVRDAAALQAELGAIATAAQAIDLPARLGCLHPHDFQFQAMKLFAKHLEGLGEGAPRDHPMRQWLFLGDVVGSPGHPRYFADRLQFYGGALAFWCCLVLSVLFGAIAVLTAD